jgi:ferredoxin
MSQIRNIIEIDEELCNGCGQCILDCAEGALELVNGKAKLVGEIFCDGLGACIGSCPTGALTITQRKAEEFDEKAVEQRLENLNSKGKAPAPEIPEIPACSCPSAESRTLTPSGASEADQGKSASTLGHWPIKLQLLQPGAPFLQNADLILLADCAAVSLPDLHSRFLPGKAIALACPKLDNPDAHIEKLAQLLEGAHPKSVTVMHMEVPCCKGLEYILEKALEKTSAKPELSSMKIARDGSIMETRNMPPKALA